MNNEIDPRTVIFPKWPKEFEGMTEEQCERVMAWHIQCEDELRKSENKRYWQGIGTCWGIMLVIAAIISLWQ